MVGLAMAAVLAALGCRETMYPFARAFGSPPESELAKCREAFRLLQSRLATGRVQVQPVLFIEDGRRQWRHDLAQAIVTEAGAHTKANWVAVGTAPEVAFAPMGANQMRHLWKRAAAYAQWVRTARPETDYVWCAEVFGQAGKVYAIQVCLFDAKGQIAYTRLFNSHHFGENLPLAGEGHIRLMVQKFFGDLLREPATIYPPYGVG